MKTCTKCKETKPISDYTKGRNQCKSCIKLYNRQYCKCNIQKTKKLKHDYNDAHKEEIKLYRKKRYQENREAAREYGITYYRNHREERLKYAKQYDKTHPKKKEHTHLPSQKWRDTHEYTKWRKSIYERDKHICQKCGTTGCKVYAHHIKEGHDFPELRYDIDNGICLCNGCHKQVHKSEKLQH